VQKNRSINTAALYAALIAVSVMALPSFAQEATGGEDESALAKKSQNPMANMISLPLQNNTTFNVGPADGTVNVLNIQPVYPMSIGDRLNIIHRVILPVVYQGEVVEGVGSESGLGDLNYTAFFTPQQPGKIIWGVGPALQVPTATDDRLGSKKWGAGVGALAITMPGQWVLGALVQNMWSFAGDSDKPDINLFFSQYFINYNLSDGWYVTSSPIITANWEADGGEKWTVPFGGGAGKVFRLGKMPVDGQVQAFVNAVKPDFAGDWSLRLQFKMLFPK